jgi:hypothetical protein
LQSLFLSSFAITSYIDECILNSCSATLSTILVMPESDDFAMPLKYYSLNPFVS